MLKKNGHRAIPKSIMVLLIIFISSTILIGCKNKEEENNQNDESEEKIVLEDIKEGVVDGYKFKETEEETDRIKIQMDNGDIILAVLSNKDTPITIKNFKTLVKNHFYDGLIFHRVIKDFMIQTGDPNGNGTGGSDKNIKGEFKENGVKNSLSHTRGVLSMARRDGSPETSETMNSASSQFFIVQKDSTYLDGKYASFGKVFAGLDVVDKIANVATDSEDKPLKEQKIHSIRFIEIIKED